MTATNQLREAEEFLHARIPLTRAMGVRVIGNDDQGFVVEAPVALNSNHLQTAFGGSINAVATLAAYGLLWTELKDRRCACCHPRKLDSFSSPNPGNDHGDLCATRSRRSFEPSGRHSKAKGKARITLRVRVEENGLNAAEFEGTFVALLTFRLRKSERRSQLLGESTAEAGGSSESSAITL